MLPFILALLFVALIYWLVHRGRKCPCCGARMEAKHSYAMTIDICPKCGHVE
jgi:hypothetical protein